MAAANIEHIIEESEQRPEALEGRTYKRKIQTSEGADTNIYITICDRDGAPFEVFLNCSDARFTEFTAVAMILASRLLRAGVDPKTIAEDLEGIHSPFTSHYATETQRFCPSLAASIGEVIRSHVES